MVEMTLRYVRDHSHTPKSKWWKFRKGVVTGYVEGRTLLVGWSMCNSNKQKRDPWNPRVGIELAKGRTISDGYRIILERGQFIKQTELAKFRIPTAAYTDLKGYVTDILERNENITHVSIYCPPVVQKESAKELPNSLESLLIAKRVIVVKKKISVSKKPASKKVATKRTLSVAVSKPKKKVSAKGKTSKKGKKTTKSSKKKSK